jgi:signal transduction histidine kinase
MDWLSLKFADPHLEHAFALASERRVARQGKVAVWMGIAVYLIHGWVLDSVLPPSQGAELWSLRLTAMLMPVLVLLLHPTPWFKKHSHFGLAMVGFAAGWGVIAMQLQVADENAAEFYPLIVEVAFYTYNLVGARFVYALCVDLSLLALYNGVFGVLHPYPLRVLLGHDFFLFSANLIGGTAGYLAEYQYRRLFLQSQELRRIQQAMLVSEAEQARVAERAHILRDMHDGVGSHISAAIRQLSGGVAHRDEVLQTLQESMDQLKLSIDSMHLPAGDINSVLANVRYRMESRLVSSGISVAWDVDWLPLISRWDEKATRQLQFMVYECISNVLQHAQASEIRIRAHQEAALTVVTISDNGRGFDVESGGQRGLQTLRQRAQSLGAQLQLCSRPGETSVEIAVAWG